MENFTYVSQLFSVFYHKFSPSAPPLSYPPTAPLTVIPTEHLPLSYRPSTSPCLTDRAPPLTVIPPERSEWSVSIHYPSLSFWSKRKRSDRIHQARHCLAQPPKAVNRRKARFAFLSPNECEGSALNLPR